MTTSQFYDVKIKTLGCQEYSQIWQAMQDFTQSRTVDTSDELWIVEHPPIFTLGLNGKILYIRDTRGIPVVHCDRGGQVTYHGPGQIILYTLLDLKRRELGIKVLVNMLEQSVVSLLQSVDLYGELKVNAPGVYVDNKKIASLGLRVRKGYTYHGLSMNVTMDLSPFSYIDPCGYPGLEVTDLKNLGVTLNSEEVGLELAKNLAKQLETR
ncbi:lipoyl(octanoyl) transferase LipB [Candidatus Nitrosacidococcus tergens]|uniref:Octanoyltransferase n=1 Tax=Candidatus Nitrosacidococcus tergens TaxID=553981 RepID=A0A7G1QB06_9GAMM|nr:lipoyl(octanoyl) transferase LipB [Candidatus Nitrosacidococcus tergens]CAB1277066.1 lipoyl-protein ligase [Candidatus Nitrosacidococcus tergens]